MHPLPPPLLLPLSVSSLHGLRDVSTLVSADARTTTLLSYTLLPLLSPLVPLLLLRASFLASSILHFSHDFKDSLLASSLLHATWVAGATRGATWYSFAAFYCTKHVSSPLLSAASLASWVASPLLLPHLERPWWWTGQAWTEPLLLSGVVAHIVVDEARRRRQKT